MVVDVEFRRRAVEVDGLNNGVARDALLDSLDLCFADYVRWGEQQLIDPEHVSDALHVTANVAYS